MTDQYDALYKAAKEKIQAMEDWCVQSPIRPVPVRLLRMSTSTTTIISLIDRIRALEMEAEFNHKNVNKAQARLFTLESEITELKR